MASFYAELQVAGSTYPVQHCAYEFSQATSERGRVVAKVRHGLVRLALDVPDDDKLLDWAHTLYKPLTGRIIFYDAKGGPALETLAWEAGQCVGYQEEFSSGDQQQGAYVCHLTIAVPKLTLQPGGPAAYVGPPPGEHGSPPQAGMPVLEPEVVEKLVEAEAGRAILQRLAQGLLRLLTSAPAMTAALVLMPTNSRDDPGYKPEWDIGRRLQEKGRLAYLENEHEHRQLTTTEEAELLDLLAKVKGVRLAKLDDAARSETGNPTGLSPWVEKRRSRMGYRGGQKLERRELQRLSKQIQANYGVEVETVQKGSAMEKRMNEFGGQAGFMASERKIYVRKGATFYELSHERYHAEQWHKLGDEAYNQQTRLEKETYVYDRLMQEKSKLTADQIQDATDYISRLRKKLN
jgi:hypothetical protein